MTQRRTMIVADHPINMADTLVGLPPEKPPLKPCPAWSDGRGKHFWMRANEKRASEADRCWYCQESRHASRDWPITLERALIGN